MDPQFSKLTILKSVLLLMVFWFASSSSALAQTAATGAQNPAGWQRLTVKNGDFSVRIPSGFVTYKSSGEHTKGGRTKFYEERIVSVYRDRVSFLVGIYKVSDSGKAIGDLSKFIRVRDGEWQSLELNGLKGSRFRDSNPRSFREVHYYASKGYVYSVDVSARDAANPLVGAFLSSVRLGKEAVATDAAAPEPDLPSPTPQASLPKPRILEFEEGDAPGVLRALMVTKPTPNYSDKARAAQVSGTVALTMVLTATGEIADIKVVDGVGHGLDEEAIRVAKLIRFLPAELDGKVVSQRVRVEYNFNIYF